MLPDSPPSANSRLRDDDDDEEKHDDNAILSASFGDSNASFFDQITKQLDEINSREKNRTEMIKQLM